MPRVLRNLKINEVSSVDRGAGEGVKVILMKRAQQKKAWGDLFLKFADESDRKSFFHKRPKLEAYCKREGNSFPIENEADLKNALRAFSRAKNADVVKAHIVKRATELDLLDDAIAALKKKKPVGGEKDSLKPGPEIEAVETDDSELDGDPSANTGLGGSNERIGKAVMALAKSTAEIVLAGGDQTDALLEKSFAEFRGYLNGDENMPKTTQELIDASVAPLTAMLGKIAKVLKIDVEKLDDDEGDDVIEKTAAEIAAEKRALAKAGKGKKPSGDGDAGSDDGDGNDDAHADEGKVGKRMADFAKAYPEVAKMLEGAQANEALLKGLQADKERSEFAKQAIAAGLDEADGDLLRKVAKGDQKSMSDLLKRVKEKTASAEALAKAAGVFSEFGSGQSGSSDSPYDQLMIKAEELRKTADGKGLSSAQAFAKVWGDPANRELVDKEKRAQFSKISKAA